MSILELEPRMNPWMLSSPDQKLTLGVGFSEMPGIPDYLELFLILVVYYRIEDDTWKIEKKEFDEKNID